MLAAIKSGFNRARQWIEHGDLILPVVGVSAAHYAVVLSGKDFWAIAFIIGVLVDLGHYRLVKAAIAYRRNRFYLGAVVLTVLAFGFHFAFYEGDGWKSLMQASAVPLVIIFLAVLSVREKWGDDKGELIRTNTQNEQRTNAEPKPQTERGDKRKRIIDEHIANPELGVTALAARLNVSKGFVSDTLKAHREQHEIGFKHTN